MSVPRFMLVLTRPGAAGDLSPAELGTATGRLVEWVGALRRWRLLDAVATVAAPPIATVAAPPIATVAVPPIATVADPAPRTVRGCLVVCATDLAAAHRLAASCPVDSGGAVEVLPVHEVVGAGDRRR